MERILDEASFNSRTRKGCDADPADYQREVLVSIHAPVKGATPVNRRPLHLLSVSIHAPVKGATKGVRYANTYRMFQFTHP